MAVVLLILKIIGILLLCVLGLALTLLLLVLFVPVRYELQGQAGDGVRREEFDAQALKKTVRGEARISWLLHILNGRVAYAEEMKNPELTVRVFCFPVFRTKLFAQEEQGKQTEREKDDAGATGDADEKKAAEKRYSAPRDDYAGAGSAARDGNTAVPEKSVFRRNKSAEAEPEQNGGPQGGGEAGKSFSEKLSEGAAAAKNRAEKLPHTFQKVCDKIKKIRRDIAYYRRLWESEMCARALAKSKKQLKKVLHQFLPRRWTVAGTVGAGDPALAGQLMEAQGLLYPWTAGHIQLTPDFTACTVELAASARGRVTLFVLAKAGVLLYFDKDVRRVLRLAKKRLKGAGVG